MSNYYFDDGPRPLTRFERFLRWMDLKLSPKPGEMLRIRPGHWHPEPSQDRACVTLYDKKPEWLRLQGYRTWKKSDLPEFWVVVERTWDEAAHKVFLRILSTGEREISGWVQYLDCNFEVVDLEQDYKKR